MSITAVSFPSAGRNTIAIGLFASACVLSVLGFLVSSTYISTLGVDDLTTNIYLGFAVMSAFIKPMLAATPWPRSWGIRAAAVVLIGAAILFDVSCGLGYSEITSGAKSEGREAAAAMYADTKSRRDGLRADLAKIPAARLIGEIEPELSPLEKSDGKPCARNLVREECRRLSELRAELARAKEIAALKAALVEAEARFDKLGPPPGETGNPMARAWQRAFSRIGIETDRKFFEYIFSVLMIILTEVGPPTLSALAAHVLRSGERPPPPKSAKPDKPPARSRKAASEGAPLLSGLKALAAGPLPAGVRRTPAGALFGPQRALAGALGVSTTTLNKGLAALAAQSCIAVNTGANGTEIEFIGS